MSKSVPDIRWIQCAGDISGIAVTFKSRAEVEYFRPGMSLLEIAGGLKRLAIRAEQLHNAERLAPRYLYVSAGTINEAREYFRKYFCENTHEWTLQLVYVNSVEALMGMTDIELHVLPSTPDNVARFIPMRSHAIKVVFV